MDNLSLYSQTEEHLGHIKLVYKKFKEAGIKFKMSKCMFWKSEIEYLGHLVSGKWIPPMKQKVKAIRVNTHN